MALRASPPGSFLPTALSIAMGADVMRVLQPYPDGWRASRNPYRARTQAVLADPASALPR